MADEFDVSRFCIHGLQLRIEPASRQFGEDAVAVSVLMKVNDRDTGEPSSIAIEKLLPGCAFVMASQRQRVVLSMLRDMVMHELDECFLVNGVRVLDPHKNEANRAR